MTVYDVIIVGSGAAGAWAAKQLKTKNILMLDVGNEPEFKYSDGIDPYYDLKKNPAQGEPILIGDNFESLSNIFTEYMSPKLKSPFMRYVVKGTSQSKLKEDGFNSQQSFATGGLGNAWGAGCYRFQDYELAKFPFESQDLQPFYDKLTEEIGISGSDDDLTRFYGTTEKLLPAIKKTHQLDTIYRQYLKKRKSFHTAGYFLGHPRLAYKNYTSKGLDYYLSHNPSIYTPAFTIQELLDQNKITYVNGMHVQSFSETTDYVEVTALNLKLSQQHAFRGKTLILAMGALNSAKCVLQSYNDQTTRLPLLDNNISYVPFLYPKMLGLSWASENVVGSPMTIVQLRENQRLPLQISLYNIGSVLISDLLYSLPLSADIMVKAAKLMLPALMIAQVFYPDVQNVQNYLSLDGKSLNLVYKKSNAGTSEQSLIAQLRKIGLFSAKTLIQYPTPGNSFHYAGMLPMRDKPTTRYQCHPDGRLNETRRVFVADAANFPELPAKNHTFTIMANSMRIANIVQRKYLE